MTGSQSSQPDSKSHTRTFVSPEAIATAVNAILDSTVKPESYTQATTFINSKNRFKDLLEDKKKNGGSNAIDLELNERFKTMNFSIHEIHTGICCYSTPSKVIAALKHFDNYLDRKNDDLDDINCERRRLTNEVLRKLIDHAKSIAELNVIKDGLEDHKKTRSLEYYRKSNSWLVSLFKRDTDSNHWVTIHEVLKRAYKKFEPVKSDEKHLSHESLAGSPKSNSPKMGYARLSDD